MEMAQAHGEKMRELQQKLHAAKEQAAAEETARLEAALKQARRESQAEFFAMHKAWCTDGKGKDDPDSRAQAGEAGEPGGVLRDAQGVVHRRQGQGRPGLARVQEVAGVGGGQDRALRWASSNALRLIPRCLPDGLS